MLERHDSSHSDSGLNGSPHENGYTQRADVHVPVLIVGGGPTGLLTAYMLSKFSVKSLLIEKYPSRLAAPKAHALCPRSLEICRQFGLDTNALRRLGSPRHDAYWVNFVTNLSGKRIGKLPYERMDSEVLNCTPEMIHNVPQPDFEQFIARQLEQDPNVDIQKGVAFVSADQSSDEDNVISTVEARATKSRWQVLSKHVIACDGARSQVRKSLGVESEGEDSYENMMTIHFKADLRPVVKDRVGMLHWITDPACSGFVIAYELGSNHVIISNLDPQKHPSGSWNPDLVRATVSAAIGQDIPFEVLSYRPWSLRRQVAKEYRRGNIFLVGDAAHSFPPTGGLGLNSGLADAHNLAYKIAAVHQGWAADSILESYEHDRRQIALVNSAQSVKNGKQIFSFLKALGTAGIDDVEKARENLHRSIEEPAKQEMIAREVEAQREHFDNLEIHIGYVYGSRETPQNASDFTPKFIAGARLPHAWIRPRSSSAALSGIPSVDVSYVKELSQEQIDARRYSTLDLASFDAFTLIVSSRGAWARRFQDLQDAVVNRKNPGLKVRLQLWAMDTDFEFVDQEQLKLFAEGARLVEGGALFVRPDQHLLDRPVPGASADDLAALVFTHLGL